MPGYAEALLPHAVRLMNVLMATTEVERLPGVDPTRLIAPPPDVPSPLRLCPDEAKDLRAAEEPAPAPRP